MNSIFIIALLSAIFPTVVNSQEEKPSYTLGTKLNADFNINHRGNYDVILSGFLSTKRLGQLNIYYSRKEDFLSSEHAILRNLTSDKKHTLPSGFSNFSPNPIFRTTEELTLTHSYRYNTKKGRKVFSMENSLTLLKYSSDNSLRFIQNRHLQNKTLQRLDIQRTIQNFNEGTTWKSEFMFFLNKRTTLEIEGGLENRNLNTHQLDFGSLEMPNYNNHYVFSNNLGINNIKREGHVSINLSGYENEVNEFNYISSWNSKWSNNIEFYYSNSNIDNSFNLEITSLDNQQQWARAYLFNYQDEEYNISNRFLYPLLEKEKIKLLVDYKVELHQADLQQNASDSLFNNRFSSQFLTNAFNLRTNLNFGKWLSPGISIGYQNIFRNMKLSEESPTEFLALHAPTVNFSYGVLIFEYLAFNFNYLYGIHNNSWGINNYSAIPNRSSADYDSFNSNSSIYHTQTIQYYVGSSWDGSLKYVNRFFSIEGRSTRRVGGLLGSENTPINNLSSLQQLLIPNPNLEIPIKDIFMFDTELYFFKDKKHSFKTETGYGITNGAITPGILFPYEDMLVLYGFDFTPGTMLMQFENVDNIISLEHHSSLNFKWKIKKTYFRLKFGMDASVREFPMIWNEELNSNYYLSTHPFSEINVSFPYDNELKIKYGLIYGSFSEELDANTFKEDVFGIHHLSLIHNWNMRPPLTLTTFVNAYYRTRIEESFENKLLFCNMELSYHKPKKKWTRKKSWKRKKLQRYMTNLAQLESLSIGVHDLFNQNNRVFRVVSSNAITDYSQQVFTRFFYFKVSLSLFNHRYHYDPNRSSYENKFFIVNP